MGISFGLGFPLGHGWGTCFPWGRQNIFAHYSAGYTLPVDNADHTALTTAGTLPDDLILITDNILKCVMDASKQTLGAYKFEQIKSYEYRLDDQARSVLSLTIQDSANVLDYYKTHKVF